MLARKFGGRAVARNIGLGLRAMSSGKSSRMSGFHKMDIPGRLAKLESSGFIKAEGMAAFTGEGLKLQDANNMIENVIANFSIPMGVSLNMLVNGREYFPLAHSPPLFPLIPSSLPLPSTPQVECPQAARPNGPQLLPAQSRAAQ
jgi:hypothetical protein